MCSPTLLLHLLTSSNSCKPRQATPVDLHHNSQIRICKACTNQLHCKQLSKLCSRQHHSSSISGLHQRQLQHWLHLQIRAIRIPTKATDLLHCPRAGTTDRASALLHLICCCDRPCCHAAFKQSSTCLALTHTQARPCQKRNSWPEQPCRTAVLSW